MAYHWNLISFALPENVDDDTVLMFTDRRDPPRFSLTVTEDALGTGASLASYVDGALAELQGEIDAYDLLSRDDKRVGSDGKMKAIAIQHAVTIAEQKTQQCQLYVAAGPGVVVFTATAAAGAMKDAEAALSVIGKSLKNR